MKQLFLIIGVYLFANTISAQINDYGIAEHRAKRNEEMRDTATTILKPEELAKFRELNFFPADTNYMVEARFVPYKKQEVMQMKTSADRIKKYNVYGYVEFSLNGIPYKLNVYQSIDLMKNPEYENYLFIPFTDLTNGNETYGGGRYLDFEKPKGDVVIIDFNLCYNPYCAYTTGYNCPVPPQENFLNTGIKAGEKKLWDEH